MPREKRTNARQPLGSKYIANLEKEAAVKRAAKKSNKRKAVDSNNNILRRNSSQSQPYTFTQSQTPYTMYVLDPSLEETYCDDSRDRSLLQGNNEPVDRSQKPEEYALSRSDCEDEENNSATKEVTKTQANGEQKRVKRKPFLQDKARVLELIVVRIYAEFIIKNRYRDKTLRKDERNAIVSIVLA